MNVTIGLAFLGGVVSFLSPCVLPVVPAYLSFLIGNQVEKEGVRPLLLMRSLLFVLGFSAIFILLGASASVIGHFIKGLRPVLSRVGGLIVIVLGLQMTGVLRLPWLLMDKRVHIDGSRSAGGGRAFLLGLSFAAGWTPCIGPVLAGILMMAGGQAEAGRGALLLAVYSLGLAVPFMLSGLLAGRAVGWIRRHGRIARLAQVGGGLIMVAMGVVLLLDRLGRLSALLPSIPLPY